MPECDPELSSLEKLAVKACCEIDPCASNALFQFQNAEVVKREHTGSGIFVYFKMKRVVDKVESKNRILEGSESIYLKHPSLSSGADVIIWLKDGIIECLEFCVFGDEKWPLDEESFSIVRL